MRWTLTFFSILSAALSAHASIWVDTDMSKPGVGGISGTVSWGEHDDGSGPTLAEMGDCTISIAHGVGPLVDQTFGHIDISQPASYQFTVDPSVGASGSYFLIFTSTSYKQNATDPNSLPYIIYSGDFQLDGMTALPNPSNTVFNVPVATTSLVGSPFTISTSSDTGSPPTTTTTDTPTTTTPTDTSITTPTDTSTTTSTDSLTTPTDTPTTTSTPTDTPTTTSTPTPTDTPTTTTTNSPTDTSSSHYNNMPPTDIPIFPMNPTRRSIKHRAPMKYVPKKGGASGVSRGTGLAIMSAVFGLRLAL